MPSTQTTTDPSTDGPTDGPPLLSMSPGRAVWAVAWPMIGLGLLRTTYFLTDSWFIGKLGDSALEAIGGSAFAWWMIHNLADLAGVGAHALVARHEGARQRDRIAATLTQGLWVSVAVTAAFRWPPICAARDLPSPLRSSARSRACPISGRRCQRPFSRMAT